MSNTENTDAELEAFRRQWRDEVQSRVHQQPQPQQPQSSSSRQLKKPPPAPKPRPQPTNLHEHEDHQESAPNVYHDLPDKEAALRLHVDDRAPLTKEPKTALDHYEKAVEKESMGSLGDSVALYRQAFRIDDRVHEKYKSKHFPPSANPPKPKAPSTSASGPQQNPWNASQTVPGTAHHSSLTMSELVNDFSQLAIPRAPPPTEASPPPPCPIAELPGEIISDILTWTAMIDLASLSRVALVCKQFAYLVMTDESIWKPIALGSDYGFAGMHYDYVCSIKGDPIEHEAQYLDQDTLDHEQSLTLSHAPRLSKTTLEIDTSLLHSMYASSWRQMFRSRPRIRFNGCYISTVNYQRPGATNTSSSTWGTPILIVTYFRYLRFFRDGTCISLLTTTEPIDVVHHLTKQNLRSYVSASNLPNSVMKDALRGRWHLSGPGNDIFSSYTTSSDTEKESEGEVHIETDGVIPKYMWKMQFSLNSSIHNSSNKKNSNNNNKLSWKGFWSYNRLTDDWGEFGLKNDKAFYFSRVKSYGMGG
jgi:F-box protein 9